MGDPTYYVDFKPAEAVQYDGTNADECEQWDPSGRIFENGYGSLVNMHPNHGRGNPLVSEGAWLVKQGDRVWVQDVEPAKVERWESEARPEAQEGETFLEYRRPVLSNGWTGPWQVVDGE